MSHLIDLDRPCVGTTVPYRSYPLSSQHVNTLVQCITVDAALIVPISPAWHLGHHEAATSTPAHAHAQNDGCRDPPGAETAETAERVPRLWVARHRSHCSW